jgi:CRISPR-associated protein Cas1
VPIEDLGILILGGSGITCSASLLSACAENNVAVVVSDEKHLPSAFLLPLAAHDTQTQILEAQITAQLPAQKRTWQEIVKAKIGAQANTLAFIGAQNAILLNMAKEVRSGDPENLEAQAARYYWPRLFGQDFRREREGVWPNALLNYGYAIVRASVARAIVGAGLHPSIGLHHHNKYNPFCLADDLMEPLRPMVDLIGWRAKKAGVITEINKEAKQTMLALLTGSVTIGGVKQEFLPAMHWYAASLRRVFTENGELEIPEWEVLADTAQCGLS